MGERLYTCEDLESCTRDVISTIIESTALSCDVDGLGNVAYFGFERDGTMIELMKHPRILSSEQRIKFLRDIKRIADLRECSDRRGIYDGEFYLQVNMDRYLFDVTITPVQGDLEHVGIEVRPAN